MTPALWFVISAACAAFVLVVVGALCLALAVRKVAMRAMRIEVPAIDLERAQRSLERLQRDAEAMTGLLTRMQLALRDIDSGIRAMMRVFSRG